MIKLTAKKQKQKQRNKNKQVSKMETTIIKWNFWNKKKLVAVGRWSTDL